MATQTVKVPDIGTDEAAEVVEVYVSEGDEIEVDQSLLVLESDKASVEVPSTHAGRVVKLLVQEGDELKTGADILQVEAAEEGGAVENGEKEQEENKGQGEKQKQGKKQAAKKEPSKATASEGSRKAEGAAKTSRQTIPVPDLGGADDVEVIEIYVSAGDQVAEGDALLALESDKASLDVPAPFGGTIAEIQLSEGDKVKEGDTIGTMDVAGGADSSPEAEKPASKAKESEPEETSQTSEETESDASSAGGEQEGGEQTVTVPDLGGADEVDLIEVSVSVGDEVEEGDSLVVLESDKASLEVPSPAKGKVLELLIKEGDKVKEGQAIARLQTQGGSKTQKAGTDKGKTEKGKKSTAQKEEKPAASSEPAEKQSVSSATPTQLSPEIPPADGRGDDSIYAGPAVRKLARQLGVDLRKVKPTGPRNRCTKEDVRNYVKDFLSGKSETGIPRIPAVDFSQYGSVTREKLSKIHRSTAANMHRSWLNVPHVTQFDEADITDLEEYRQEQKTEAAKREVKLTPVPFLLKACAMALREEPSFNVSLDVDDQHIFKKDYVHIGMAVDTPAGLMVPVIRDVDQKDIWQLARETSEMAEKARDGKLAPRDMRGGCFSISSLGAIGGQGFTPIVNSPEVGILGVSKAAMKPWWDGHAFVARKFLPLSLSYDHRAVNGADAGRFLTFLVEILQDYKKLLD